MRAFDWAAARPAFKHGRGANAPLGRRAFLGQTGCMTQDMAEPRPLAGAGAIVWRGDEVLLIRRGKPPRLGEWSIPGGRIEGGETAREAAIRETLEETGCAIEIVALCDVYDALRMPRPYKPRLMPSQTTHALSKCRVAQATSAPR